MWFGVGEFWCWFGALFGATYIYTSLIWWGYSQFKVDNAFSFSYLTINWFLNFVLMLRCISYFDVLESTTITKRKQSIFNVFSNNQN